MPGSALLALVWHMEKKAAQETDKLAQERLRVIISHVRQECMNRAMHRRRNKPPH